MENSRISADLGRKWKPTQSSRIFGIQAALGKHPCLNTAIPPMKKSFRQTIRTSYFLQNHPLLFLLLSSKWFCYCFLLVAAIAIGTPLSTLKIIQTSSPESVPIIKISALDWLQAESLARTARVARSNENLDLAFHAWRSAIGNHPTKARFNREYLETLIHLDAKKRYWKDALQTSHWLLHITQTNRADLELTSQALEFYHLDRINLELIRSYSGKRTLKIEQSQLRSLFRTGRNEMFLQKWSKAPKPVTRDASVQLFKLACDASQVPAGDPNPALELLEKQALTSIREEEARRLKLFVFHRQLDLPNFKRIFDELTEHFQARIPDHLLYWDLLQRSGKNQTAVSLAQEFILPPQTGYHVMEIADAYTKLGLNREAFNYLKNYAGLFGSQEQQRFAQSQLLIHEEDWAGLKRFALDLRNSPGMSNPFMAYSHYLEGLASYHQGRQWEADPSFQRINTFPIKGSQLALLVGANLWDLGYGKEAFEILSPERHDQTNNAAYWSMLLEITASLQMGPQMLTAAERLFQLVPADPRHQINFASILVSQQTQMDRAIALLFDALSKDPDNPIVKVNYAQALALNGRADEAQKYLRTIHAHSLSPWESHGYAFAWLVCYHAEKNPAKALQLASRIHPERLLPGDRENFESILNWARNTPQMARTD